MKAQVHNEFLELPADLNARVDKIVSLNSFNKRNLLLNAINSYIEDYEDAEEALERAKDPDNILYTSEEVRLMLEEDDNEEL